MKTPHDVYLNALDAHGWGLRVEFFRLRDRFAHRVLAVASERVLATLLESTEGSDADDWPESPALQALAVDQIKQGGAAALIGMSGGNHWSLSVERRLDGGALGLMFDAACRIRSAPPRLGSAYRLGRGVEARTFESQHAPPAVSLRAADREIVIRTLNNADSTLQPTISAASDKCAVVVDVRAIAESSRTLRWRYAVEMLSGS